MINRVVLVGRLTKDPELRHTQSGLAVASFTVAVNRPYTDQSGERQADFINCVIWRKPAENVAKYLKKGNLAGVEGRMQTRHYEGQDGKRVYVTEVMCDSVQFLEPKSKNGQGGYQPPGDQDQPPGNNYNQNKDKDHPFADGSTPIDISDDDLPF